MRMAWQPSPGAWFSGPTPTGPPPPTATALVLAATLPQQPVKSPTSGVGRSTRCWLLPSRMTARASPTPPVCLRQVSSENVVGWGVVGSFNQVGHSLVPVDLCLVSIDLCLVSVELWLVSVDLCVGSVDLCLSSVDICLVSDDLCKVSVDLCLVSVYLFLISVGLCLVSIDLCLVSVELFLVSVDLCLVSVYVLFYFIYSTHHVSMLCSLFLGYNRRLLSCLELVGGLPDRLLYGSSYLKGQLLYQPSL